LARQARDTALILGIALDRGMNLVPLQVEHAHGHGMRRPVYVGDKHGDRRHVSNGAQKKCQSASNFSTSKHTQKRTALQASRCGSAHRRIS
jgi:hypothetical protein